MPLPANVTTVTVLGTFLTPEGDPSTGTVSFTPSSWLLNSGANIAIPNSSVVKTLGTAGDFSAVLPITDDPDLSPGGWVYSVSEVVDGVSQSYNIAIPGTVAAGGTVFLADLAPVAPAGPEYYSLASSLAIGTVTNVGAGGTPTASITGLAPSQVLNLGVPQGLPGAPGSLNEPSVQQFAADGSVLRNLPARTLGAEALLKQAVWWIDSAHSSASGQAVTNLGWGGSALNAQLGSSGSADSNDPKWLDWTGENYVYLPGVATNRLQVSSADVPVSTGDMTLIAKVALDDWTPGGTTQLICKGIYPNHNYSITINSVGRPSFLFTTSAGWDFASATATPSFTDGSVYWVAATLDADNGSGGADFRFFTSDDGVSWTQLGATVTKSGPLTLSTNATDLTVGTDGNGAESMAGKVYRAIVRNGIGAGGVPGGTPVLDIDTSLVASGAATSFTALTGQTVTINRSTTGRKAVAVTHPCWLLGTDDYLEVPDNDLLDFGASDSFTVLAVVRRTGTLANFNTAFAKRGGAGSAVGAGYVARLNADGRAYFFVQGTTAERQVSTPQITTGFIASIALVHTAASTVGYANGVAGTADTAGTVGDLTNALTFRIGRGSTISEYADMEFIAAAVFRRALTASEIATLTNYYSARIGA